MKKVVAVFVCLLFLASTLGMTAVVLAAPPDKCEPWPECKGGGEEPPMGTEYQITDWPQWEVVPTIHGNMIVWETYVDGDYELFVYDLGDDGIPFTADDGGQTQITDNSVTDDFPRIYGNKIAFRRAIGSSDYDLWLYDLDTDAECTYELVIAEAADATVGKISIASPIGRGLMGKQKGDEVHIKIPSGVKNLEITSMETIHQLGKNFQTPATASF